MKKIERKNKKRKRLKPYLGLGLPIWPINSTHARLAHPPRAPVIPLPCGPYSSVSTALAPPSLPLVRGARKSARSHLPQRIPPSSAMTVHCRVGPSCLSLWRVRLRCVADKSAPLSVASTASRICLNELRPCRI